MWSTTQGVALGYHLSRRWRWQRIAVLMTNIASD
jgi:hypothetical protein